MKKEVLLAVLVGSGIGLFLAFGFYKANRAVKSKAQKAGSQPTENPTKNHLTPTDNGDSTLAVDFPMDNQVFFDQSATVSGQTTSKSPVIIVVEEDEYITVADLAGNFSQPITLIKGINEVSIISVNNMESTKEEKLSLIYTTEEIEDE